LLAWRDLRTRRILSWIAFFGWPVLGALLSVNRLFVVAFAPAALFVAARVWASQFRCPRCGHRFESQGLNNNPWARTCHACGLRRGELKGPDPKG
jgi:hypothetical protein